jgi:hypothetical protein
MSRFYYKFFQTHSRVMYILMDDRVLDTNLHPRHL